MEISRDPSHSEGEELFMDDEKQVFRRFMFDDRLLIFVFLIDFSNLSRMLTRMPIALSSSCSSATNNLSRVYVPSSGISSFHNRLF